MTSRSAAILAAIFLSGCATVTPKWSDFREGKNYMGVALDDVRTARDAFSSAYGQANASREWYNHRIELTHGYLPPEPNETFADKAIFFFHQENSPEDFRTVLLKAPVPAAGFEFNWPADFRKRAKELGFEIKGLIGVTRDFGMLYETSFPGYYAALEKNEGPEPASLKRVFLVKEPDWFWKAVGLKTVAVASAELDQLIASHASNDAIETMMALFFEVPTKEAQAVIARANQVLSANEKQHGATGAAQLKTKLTELTVATKKGSVADRFSALSQLATLVAEAKSSSSNIPPEFAAPLATALTEVAAALEDEKQKAGKDAAPIFLAAAELLKKRAAVGLSGGYAALAETSASIDAANQSALDALALTAKESLNAQFRRASEAKARATLQHASLTSKLFALDTAAQGAHVAAEAEAAAEVAEHAGHLATAAGLYVLANEATEAPRVSKKRANALLIKLTDEIAPVVDPSTPAELIDAVDGCYQTLGRMRGGLQTAGTGLGDTKVAAHFAQAKILGRPVVKLQAGRLQINAPKARIEPFKDTFSRVDEVEVANSDAMRAWEEKMRGLRSAASQARSEANRAGTDYDQLEGVESVSVDKSNKASVDEFKAHVGREHGRINDMQRQADSLERAANKAYEERPSETSTHRATVEHSYIGERQIWEGSMQGTVKLVTAHGSTGELPIKAESDFKYDRVKEQRGLPGRNEWKTPAQVEAELLAGLHRQQGDGLCRLLEAELKQNVEARVTKLKSGPGDETAKRTEEAWVRYFFSAPADERKAALGVPAPGTRPSLPEKAPAVAEGEWHFDRFDTQSAFTGFELSPDGSALVAWTPTGVDVASTSHARSRGHFGKEAATDATFNASGRRILVTWASGAIDLLNAETLAVVVHANYPGHTVKFSGDGRRLLVEDPGELPGATIYDTVTGRKRAQFRFANQVSDALDKGGTPVRARPGNTEVSFSQFGNIRKAEMKPSGMRVVQTEGGEVVLETPQDFVHDAHGLVISADGSTVAMGHRETAIHIWRQGL